MNMCLNRINAIVMSYCCRTMCNEWWVVGRMANIGARGCIYTGFEGPSSQLLIFTLLNLSLEVQAADWQASQGAK